MRPPVLTIVRGGFQLVDLWSGCIPAVSVVVVREVLVIPRLDVIVVKPGVNFTNVICIAFMHADSKSIKNTVKLIIFFMPSGSTSIKAAHRMLMKLTPERTQIHCWRSLCLTTCHNEGKDNAGNQKT